MMSIHSNNVFLFLLILIHSFDYYSTWALRSLDGIELLGRFHSFRDEHGDIQYSADWPASGIRFYVQPIPDNNDEISISMTFQSSGSSFRYFVTAFVDNMDIEKFDINPSKLSLSFSFSTKEKNLIHTVVLRKVTEASYLEASGNMTLGELTISGGQQITQLQRRKKKKLFVIGDSITCGYGVDGRNARCPFSAATEDVTHAYAYIVANVLHADIDIICWSGYGVIRNYGDKQEASDMPMPKYYNRTIATMSPDETFNGTVASSYWQPQRYSPDIVIIALGTNDYSTSPQPNDEHFIAAYKDLVMRIHRDYPNARVLATCEPMHRGKQCENIQKAAKESRANYFQVPDRTLIGGKGCHHHPNRRAQQNIAEALIPIVQDLLA